MRSKLKGRIIELYNSQANFCKKAGITGAYLSMILNCQSNGSYKFWEKIKALLNISDSEIEGYKKSNGANKNEDK
jgi:transcriptional regulator with XRE-family HTH domain